VQSSAVTTVTALTVFNTGDAGCSSTRALNFGDLLLGSAGFGTSGQGYQGGIGKVTEIS